MMECMNAMVMMVNPSYNGSHGVYACNNDDGNIVHPLIVMVCINAMVMMVNRSCNGSHGAYAYNSSDGDIVHEYL